MSGWALFQIATTLSMLGTQVQKVSVTFWPEDAGADADAADDDGPAAGGVEDELPDEEQPAATSAASTVLASTGPAVAAARLRRRAGMSFMVPPR
jgi:hypothetical protein